MAYSDWDIQLYTDITIDILDNHPNDMFIFRQNESKSRILRVKLLKGGEKFLINNYTVKYDATVGGYLAEEDASGNASMYYAVIPITDNMTAQPGKLCIDIKIVNGDSVLVIKMVEGYVAASCIGLSSLIDVSGTTLMQALNSKAPLSFGTSVPTGSTPGLIGELKWILTSHRFFICYNKTTLGVYQWDELATQAQIENKDDKIIIAPITLTTRVQQLAHNHEYRCGTMVSLEVTLPNTLSDNYTSNIVFSSGATPTSFIYPSSIKWSGDDVSNGNFVPAANKRYDIVLWYNGVNVNAVVLGVA